MRFELAKSGRPRLFPEWADGVIEPFPKLRDLTWETPESPPAPYLRTTPGGTSRWPIAARDLAGRAVDDFGRGRNTDAHGQHRTLADDDALHDLGTGTDEAVVLDAGRIAPGRLTWAK